MATARPRPALRAPCGGLGSRAMHVVFSTRPFEQVLKNCLDTEREGAYALVEQMRSEAVSLGVPLRALLSAAPSPRASLVAALGAVEEDSIASAALFTQVLLSSEDPGASREALTALWARPMTGRDEVRRLVATLDDCDSGSLLHEDLQLLLENRSTDEWGWLLEPGRAVGRAGRALLLRAIGTCGGDSAPVMDFLIRGLGAEDEDVLEAAFEALVGLSERRVALPSGVAELAMARAVAGGGTEVRRLCLVSLSYSSRPSHEVADAALRAVWDPESPFWDATALLIESREYREALGRAFASLERNRRGEVAMRLAGSSGLGKPSAALAKALLRAEPDELVQLSLLRTWAVLEEGPALSSELLGLRTALLPAARADAARLRFHVTGERDASLRDVMGVLDGLSSADAKVVAIDALVSLGDLDGDARAALDRLIADRTQPEHVREAAASAKVGRRSPGGGR